MSLFTIRTLIDYVYSDATYDWVESELSFGAGDVHTLRRKYGAMRVLIPGSRKGWAITC